MRTLPKLPARIPHKQSQVLRFLGINYSDDYNVGNLAECKNISARRYPYFTTRNERSKLEGTGMTNVSAMTHWNKMVTVSNPFIYYDGNIVGEITPGDKQFAVLNTKLVIFPDKKYLDLENLTLHDLGAEASFRNATFTSNTITRASQSFARQFNVGDALVISGCSTQPDNNRTMIVKSVTDTVITFTTDTLVACTEAGLCKVERKIPDLDYICEAENRLWGCSNTDKTLYASALGDPTNFFDYSGTSTDSYAVAVGSEGDFTGCCKLQSSVLFFKEASVHKILGSYPAEYQMYTYKLDGVKAGCYKSLMEINGTLFYMGLHGVTTYGGGSTSSLASTFGNHSYSNASAGTDGERYYISCQENNQWNLFVYDLKHGLWLREDNTHAVSFARNGAELYILDSDGDILVADAGTQSSSMEWNMQFCPFVETISGSYNSKSSIFERKRYSKLILRVDMAELSHAYVDVRFDEGAWEQVGELYGEEKNIRPLVIRINRCDKFEIRIHGTGEFTLLNMERFYIVGSDRS